MAATPETECLTCPIVKEYVGLANDFTQSMSTALMPGMYFLFASMVGVWIIIHGFKLALGKMQLLEIGHEFLYIVVAFILLSGQGPGLVNTIFTAALTMMGSGAAVALNAAGDGNLDPVPFNQGLEGMQALAARSEEGLMAVLGVGFNLLENAGITNLANILYAIALILPYGALILVYFSQVVIAIFRVMMLATFSPFVMLGFAFGWGRDMAYKSIKTLVSSFLVLFAATASVAVCIYAVSQLGEDPQALNKFARFDNPKFILIIALGYIGTAMLTEATGLANSITDTVLQNTAAGIITAGGVATAGLGYKAGKWGAGRVYKAGKWGAGRAWDKGTSALGEYRRKFGGSSPPSAS